MWVWKGDGIAGVTGKMYVIICNPFFSSSSSSALQSKLPSKRSFTFNHTHARAHIYILWVLKVSHFHFTRCRCRLYLIHFKCTVWICMRTACSYLKFHVNAFFLFFGAIFGMWLCASINGKGMTWKWHWRQDDYVIKIKLKNNNNNNDKEE